MEHQLEQLTAVLINFLTRPMIDIQVIALALIGLWFWIVKPTVLRHRAYIRSAATLGDGEQSDLRTQSPQVELPTTAAVFVSLFTGTDDRPQLLRGLRDLHTALLGLTSRMWLVKTMFWYAALRIVAALLFDHVVTITQRVFPRQS